MGIIKLEVEQENVVAIRTMNEMLKFKMTGSLNVQDGKLVSYTQGCFYNDPVLCIKCKAEEEQLKADKVDKILKKMNVSQDELNIILEHYKNK